MGLKVKFLSVWLNDEIAKKFDNGEVLTTRDFEEIYQQFGLSANSARTSLPNHMRFRRYTKETGVPVIIIRFGRRLYYMHPKIRDASDYLERVKTKDQQYKEQRVAKSSLNP